MKSALALSILALLLVSACSPAAVPSQPTGSQTGTGTYNQASFDPSADVAPKTFATEEEFLAFLKAHRGGGGVGTAARDMAQYDAVAPTAAPTATKAESSGGSANSYSGTNNQVASVDEADIIKTDGEYIYTVTGTTVFIIKAYPGADAKIVSQIELKSQPSGIFVDGNKLAVFGNFYDVDYFKKMDLRPRNGMTYFTVYDIADKTKPVVAKEYKFEGSYFESRMKDGYVYFALNSGNDYRNEMPMPLIIEGDIKSTVPVTDIYYFPVPYNSVQFQTIHAIPLSAAGVLDSKTITVEGSNTLYMSEKNIYLAYTEYINEWTLRQDIMMELVEPKLTDADRKLIAKIKATDDDVLSQAEKQGKIAQVYQDYVNYLGTQEQQDLQDKMDEALKKELDKYEAYEYTVINKLGIDNGQITVGPTVKVPGHLNNQFALDEHNDVLRAATTVSARWWGGPIRPMMDVAVAVPTPAVAPDEAVDAKMIAPPSNQAQSTNNVYTFDSNLKMLDKITDIAPGETIFSTRFMGDRLYMVTFQQVDPFFAIDLANPSDIKMLGKLKVPGFSRYLHPYDENTIIGIGREASSTGRQQGLKISLFDVTDVANPKEVARFVTEDDYAQSTAEWEHKAFLFDKDKELLVIPAYSYDYDYKTGGRQNYNGAMVFHIARDDITLRGIVDHSNGNQNYGPLVERSLFINDLLYTKSMNLLRINSLDDLSAVNKIALTESSKSPYPIY